MNCPSCQSTDTARCEMVYSQGTHSGSYGGTSVMGGNIGGQWGAGVGTHQGTTFNQTQLAQYCRPPSPPSGGYATILYIFFGFGAVASATYFALACIITFALKGITSIFPVILHLGVSPKELCNLLIIPTFLVSVLVAVAVGILIAKKSSKSHKTAQQAYLQQLETWEKTWICLRCGYLWYFE